MRAPIITPMLAFALSAGAAAAETAPQTRTLFINDAEVRAEIADTPAARRGGFSHRERPPPDAGILFVFPRPRQFCLWMRDVSFPLDAAFLDAAGKVIAAARMLPRTEKLHCPPRPAKYALEVNAGWLQKNQVKTGDQFFGLP